MRRASVMVFISIVMATAASGCITDYTGYSLRATPTVACELVGDSTCSIGCSFFDDGTTACRAFAGSAVRGSACSSDYDCEAGLACDDGAGRCSTYCRPDESNCASGAACLTQGRVVIVVDAVSYGYCAL